LKRYKKVIMDLRLLRRSDRIPQRRQRSYCPEEKNRKEICRPVDSEKEKHLREKKERGKEKGKRAPKERQPDPKGYLPVPEHDHALAAPALKRGH